MHDDRHAPTTAACPDFAAEIVATTGALIVAFNPACERLTGYRFAEVQGQPFWRVFLTDDELAHARWRATAGRRTIVRRPAVL